MSRLGPLALHTNVTGAADSNPLSVAGLGTAAFQVVGSPGTMVVQATIALGGVAPSDWITIRSVNMNSMAQGATISAAGLYVAAVGGFTHIRVSLTGAAAAYVRCTVVDASLADFLAGTGGGGSSTGNIVDGVNSAILATVFNYTNSKPLAVSLRDTNGDAISVGGGTQYTEDAVSTADPVGNMLLARRRDTLVTNEVTADGDNIALNATNKGQLHTFSQQLPAALGLQTPSAALSVFAGYDQTSSGSLTALNSTLNLTVRGGLAVVQIAGTWAGTVSFLGNTGGSDVALSAWNGTTFATTTTANGTFYIPMAGFSSFQIKMTAYTSGTAFVNLNISTSDLSQGFFPLPTGTNVIGSVKVTDGTNFLPTMDAATRAGFQKVTDGTNTMPTMDAAARAGFQKITDGTNSMPTMDAVARAGFQKITDGTNTATVKAASAAAVATDPALVVSLSPNSPVNVAGTGGQLQPSMDAAVRAGWVKITDGTNLLPTMDAVGRPGFQKITDGTNTMPTMDAVARAGFQKVTDGTNTAAVKAASVAAVATDPALVVVVSPNNTVFVDTELPSASGQGDGTSNPTVPVVGAFGSFYNGTTWDRMRGTTTGGMWANLKQINDTTIVTGGVAGSQSVGGTVATNVAITANPLNLGAQAVSSENAAVTTARQVQLVADLVGKQIVLPYANPENFISSSLAAITDNTTHSLFASQGGSLRSYITQITVTNSHATVGTLVSIKDGAGGTVLCQGYAAPAGGGFTATFPTPLKGTAATLVEAICGTTGANVYVCGSGYKGV